ncbi:hypothetical protein HDV02_004411 [Globomyces sp. JEL0801]|nr:hypothetical protein HDV02_004411 [Globomyces sp. JEL0801]
MENKPRHRASLDDSKSTGLVPPGKLFSGGQIPKSPSGSLCRLNPNNVLKPVPDSDTAKTNLDSESESDMPVTWSEITKTSILLTVSDDQEDNIVEPSPKKQPRSKRSPNRDDSDSDDEDDNGNKIIKPKVEDTEFNPETDHQYLNSGFKVGFAEDRNKKYRRTMEVLIRDLILGFAHNML